MRNITAILLGMSLASGVAIGAENPKFDDVDLDGDGKLNQTEAAQAGVDLESSDMDGDGALSESEYQAAVDGSKEGTEDES